MEKKEKEKKKEVNIQFTTFCNRCNITKPFELVSTRKIYRHRI